MWVPAPAPAVKFTAKLSKPEIDGTATTSSVNLLANSSQQVSISFHYPTGYIHEGTSLTIEDKPNTIQTVQYRLFFQSHNNSAVVGVARDWGGAHFTVMEVRE